MNSIAKLSMFEILGNLTMEDYSAIAHRLAFTSPDDSAVFSMIAHDRIDAAVMTKLTRQHEGISQHGYLI